MSEYILSIIRSINKELTIIYKGKKYTAERDIEYENKCITQTIYYAGSYKKDSHQIYLLDISRLETHLNQSAENLLIYLINKNPDFKETPIKTDNVVHKLFTDILGEK